MPRPETPEDFPGNRRGWLLGAILVAATVLRFWGIRYGLPYIYYPDECSVIHRALAMGSGDLNPHFFEYPALTMYFLAFVYGVSFVIAYLVGWVGSVHDFALAFVQDPTYFFLIARGIVALLGVGAVWLVYVLGRRLFDWRIGLTAAALLAVSPEHVGFSHFVKVEGPQTFFVIWTLIAARRVLERPTLRQYVLAGILAGVSAAIKYPGCLTFLAVFMAHLLANWSRGRGWRLFFDKRLWLSGLAMIGVFLATNPFIVLDFRAFWSDLAYQAQASNAVWIGASASAFWEWIGASIAVQGYVITVACVIGVPYYAIRRRREHLVALSFVLIFFLIVGGQRLHQLHWLLPIVPCALIFSAAFARDAAGAIFRSQSAQAYVLAFLTAIALAETLPPSIAQDRYLTLPDTRTLAKEWIEQNIPAGSKILMDHGRYMAGYTAPINMDAATIDELYLKDTSRQGGVEEPGEPHAERYYRLLIEATRGKTAYPIIPITHDSLGGKTAKRNRPKPESLDYYITGKHVQYIVTSSRYSDPYFAPDQPKENIEYSRPFVEFYTSVYQRCPLLKEFSPVSGKMQGPEIRIYRIVQSR